MIDPTVVMDKLRNFETADELAAYFKEEGVKGVRATASSCPIALYFTQHTGKKVTVSSRIKIWESEVQMGESFGHTPATEKFIDLFDEGFYPELCQR